MIPTLETDRLILRPHRREDFDSCAALWANLDVVRYIGGKPFTREEVWARLLRYAGHWQWLGFGFWALEERATGTFAGELGFAEFMRDLDPPIVGTPEVGWVLAPHAHGKGYATEALRTVLAWGDAHFNGGRTVCLIDPENAASIRVAQKCGFGQPQTVTYKNHPTLLWERLP